MQTNNDNGTSWFVGIIIALALLAIGYLIFSSAKASETVKFVQKTELHNIDVQTKCTQKFVCGAALD